MFVTNHKYMKLNNCSVSQLYYDKNLYVPSLFEHYGIESPEKIQRSVHKRQAEYLAGRISAIKALASLDIQTIDIPTGIHRNPIWPPQIAGSISHTEDLAICVVAQRNVCNCIGVDCENWMTQDTAVRVQEMIVNEREIELMNSIALAMEKLTTLVFSAKESLFKALYPWVKNWFDFSVAEVINIDLVQDTIELELLEELTPMLTKGTRFTANFANQTKHTTTYITCLLPEVTLL